MAQCKLKLYDPYAAIRDCTLALGRCLHGKSAKIPVLQVVEVDLLKYIFDTLERHLIMHRQSMFDFSRILSISTTPHTRILKYSLLGRSYCAGPL